ncbi:MAG: DNA polymerase [Methanophagales virus PBV082]|uniref:DNA-directed DNA polymerase n=1 Tax=Methanophagales virus PBV082 TaxID=3071307 RepID=A0AA46TDZ5_9VIRU|nr:MAG: DNA polymerase [Methanophagales virus PBV082]UYL64947.1 MAG: DNA polymerase [Methanophagales virus PBV082]
MKGLLITIHSYGRRIVMWVRSEDGRKRKVFVDDFFPYFYVPGASGECKSLFGENVRKIVMEDPSEVPKEREKYRKTYEADIPFVRRFLIDTGIKSGLEFPQFGTVSWKEIKPAEVDVEPLVLYLDIEVISEKFIEPEKATEPIVAISFTTNKANVIYTLTLNAERVDEENWKVLPFTTEKMMLGYFVQMLWKLKPDILTGWNIIKYDFPYLLKRLEYNEIYLDTSFFEVFDLYEAYRKLYHQPSYHLKRIVEFEFGEKRESFADVRHLWEKNREKFLEYNRDDVRDVKRIDEKHNIIKFFHTLKTAVGVEELERCFSYSRLIDTQLLRIARKMNVVLPTKTDKNKREKYEGAIVDVCGKGIYRNVAVFDFSRYYPNIIHTFFLSPENLIVGDEKSVIEIDTGRRKVKVRKRKGIAQHLISLFFGLRNEIEEEMKKHKVDSEEYKSLALRRQAVKDLTNAIYGVFGYSGFRLFRMEIAEAVTALGREGITVAKEIASRHGYRVVLSDTDSIYVQLPFERVEEFQNVLNDGIAEYFRKKYGVDDVELKLKFEKYVDKILLTGVKKRYAMRVIYEGGECDYMVVRGFENVRTDYSLFTREMMDELFRMILYEGNSKERLLEFLERKRKEMKEQDMVKIAIPKGIHKTLQHYDANLPHIRGALYSNRYFGTNFTVGDKVLMVYVKGIRGFPSTDVFVFSEDMDLNGLEVEIDWKRMEGVNILKRVEPIFDALGIPNILTSSHHTSQVKLF